MLFAAFANVLGDVPALNSVLQELDELGVQVIVNTGDTVLDAIGSRAVLNTLADHKTHDVQGATDRKVARLARRTETYKNKLDPAEFEQIKKCSQSLSAAQIDRLAGLPAARLLTIEGASVALCHGTWNRATQFLRPDSGLEWFRRQREAQPAAVFVLGGPGPAFARIVDQTLFVHPGSVHRNDGGAPEYALISTDESPARAELRNVAPR